MICGNKTDFIIPACYAPGMRVRVKYGKLIAVYPVPQFEERVLETVNRKFNADFGKNAKLTYMHIIVI